MASSVYKNLTSDDTSSPAFSYEEKEPREFNYIYRIAMDKKGDFVKNCLKERFFINYGLRIMRSY